MINQLGKTMNIKKLGRLAKNCELTPAEKFICDKYTRLGYIVFRGSCGKPDFLIVRIDRGLISEMFYVEVKTILFTRLQLENFSEIMKTTPIRIEAIADFSDKTQSIMGELCHQATESQTKATLSIDKLIQDLIEIREKMERGQRLYAELEILEGDEDATRL